MKKSFHKQQFNFIFFLFALLFSSCAKGGPVDFYAMREGGPRAFTTMQKSARGQATAADMDFMADEESIESASLDFMPESSKEYGNTERKLIKNANINLEVESLEGVENLISKFAESLGGYVTNSSSSETTYNATVRIPAAKLDEAMRLCSDFGKIRYKNLYSQDVTEEFYDLETRLSTKKLMRDKLEKYLSQAKDISDLLQIESQLNSVISEIEVMEGRMKRLSNQIEYSTIYINMNLPSGYSDNGFVWPDLGEDFKQFGVNVIHFLEKFFMALFYIIVFGTPIIALIALLYWLLFGRVGLLVRLFKKLSGKKKN
ncbi:MAG: DUF4349 domain-containing protein [Treponema sp.]|nr:DUF4349 domain-containing protein [Treponema sp.]